MYAIKCQDLNSSPIISMNCYISTGINFNTI